MKCLTFYGSLTIGLCIFLITTVKSDISDDECGVWEDEETTTIANSPDKPANISSTAKLSKRDEYFAKRKKSLVIVFDGTGSMHDDLVQMRDAAKEIVNSLLAKEDKPIKNFVLVVFKDPVHCFLPIVNTEDPKELFAKLDAIKLGCPDNVDAPELPITGIKFALKHTMQNSLVYVFTDAAAKDHADQTQVLPIIQKKQVKVNFIITGDVAANKADPAYIVYENLARASEGQVFVMKRDIIKNVLMAITSSLDPNYATLASINSDKAGSTTKAVKVDQGFSSLQVSMSGTNSKLSVKDKNNNQVVTKEGFNSDNIKFMTFDVADSLYTIEASAESAYSIRVGGISELKFDFGFSTFFPSEQAETSTQPLKGTKNILSIFVSNHDLVKCLTQATLLPANPDDSFDEFDIAFERKKRSIYSSKAFDVPTKMFKIRIFGYDKKRNVIERLISTGIESAEGVKPEVNIEYSTLQVNQYQSLHLNCKVSSQFPTITTWFFESNVLNVKNSNQSTENVLNIKKFDVKNVGKYACEASNSLGRESKNVSVTIKLAPTVKVVPDYLNMKEGDTGSLNCVVEGNYSEVKILWKDEFDVLGVKNLSTYQFTATRHHHDNFINCEIIDEDFVVHNSSLVTVKYPPEFFFGVNGGAIKRDINYGENFTLNCESHENPAGTVEWFFSIDRRSEKNLLDEDTKLLKLYKMRNTMQGVYQCVIINSAGNSTKFFIVKNIPHEKPNIERERDMVVKQNQYVELECSCRGCLPIKDTNWNYTNKIQRKFKIRSVVDQENDKFTTVLTIPKVTLKDEGDYECEIRNYLGKDVQKIHVSTQTEPNDIKVTMSLRKSFKQVDKVIEVTERETLTLNCFANAFPKPEISWFKNGNKLGKNPITLPKDKVNQHAGKYQCIVKNILGSISKDFQVFVKIPPKPSAKLLKDQIIEAKINNNVKLKCEISGIPEPKITWSFNGKPLTASKSHKITNNNKILDFQGQIGNLGTYFCFGKNDFGTASVKFTVNMKTPPSFLNPKDEVIKKRVHVRLQLSCQTNGYPKPLVTWFKVGSKAKIADGEHFTIPSLKTDHSGTYWCHAKNIVKEVKKKFEVSVVDPPGFGEALEDVQLFEGENRTVEVFVFGHPQPKVHWSFNGVKFHDGETLLMTSMMKSGRYSCVAVNSEGQKENSFFLTVVIEPKLLKNFDESQRIKNVGKESDLELLCPFENFEDVIWERNGVPLNQKTEKLKIKKINKLTTGEYKCTASNLIGIKSFSYQVNLFTAPTISVIDSKTSEMVLEVMTLKFGQTLNLSCEARGNPEPEIEWVKPEGQKVQGKYLMVENLTDNNEGTYTCNAKNGQGSAKMIVKLSLSSVPYIEDGISQVSKEKSAGDVLRLECKIDGYPKPNFIWTKNRSYITESSKFLELKNVTGEQTGDYECIGNNSFGKESIKFKVFVQEPANIVSVSELEKENEVVNDSITISCVVKGNPLPKVTWLDGKLILSTTDRLDLESLFGTKTTTVYLDRRGNKISDPFKSREYFYVQLSKEGDYSLRFELVFKDRRRINLRNYKCITENDYGNDEKKIVKGAVDDRFIKFSDGGNNETNIDAKYGEELNLKCEIEGSPKPVIRWMFGIEEVTKNVRDLTLSKDKQILTISSANKVHQTNIYCLGVNSLASLQRFFFIKVEMKAKWTPWSAWSACSAEEECGTGFQAHLRECLLPNGEKPSDSDESDCHGENFGSRHCKNECVIEGWTEWSDYTPCSKSCGTGYQMKTRECKVPKEQRVGKICKGLSEAYKYCTNPAC